MYYTLVPTGDHYRVMVGDQIIGYVWHGKEAWCADTRYGELRFSGFHNMYQAAEWVVENA
jgi:hypothetical protein